MREGGDSRNHVGVRRLCRKRSRGRGVAGGRGRRRRGTRRAHLGAELHGAGGRGSRPGLLFRGPGHLGHLDAGRRFPDRPERDAFRRVSHRQHDPGHHGRQQGLLGGQQNGRGRVRLDGIPDPGPGHPLHRALPGGHPQGPPIYRVVPPVAQAGGGAQGRPEPARRGSGPQPHRQHGRRPGGDSRGPGRGGGDSGPRFSADDGRVPDPGRLSGGENGRGGPGGGADLQRRGRDRVRRFHGRVESDARDPFRGEPVGIAGGVSRVDEAGQSGGPVAGGGAQRSRGGLRRGGPGGGGRPECGRRVHPRLRRRLRAEPEFARPGFHDSGRRQALRLLADGRGRRRPGLPEAGPGDGHAGLPGGLPGRRVSRGGV